MIISLPGQMRRLGQHRDSLSLMVDGGAGKVRMKGEMKDTRLTLCSGLVANGLLSRTM